MIAAAQLMLVLDDSIVNIALPNIQQELGVDPVHLPWIVNAYILAFGALLLLGGRIGDLYGRRRVLQAGLAIFVLASLAGGIGVNSEMLIAARAIQGLGAALVAPNALALITTTFSDRKTRTRGCPSMVQCPASESSLACCSAASSPAPSAGGGSSLSTSHRDPRSPRQPKPRRSGPPPRNPRPQGRGAGNERHGRPGVRHYPLW